MQITLSELAELVGGEVRGDGNCEITGVSSIEEAMPGDLVFAEGARYPLYGCRLVGVGHSCSGHCEEHRQALDPGRRAQICLCQNTEVFGPKLKIEPGIHGSAHVGEGFHRGEGVAVRYGSYVGNNVKMGERASVGPLAYIGDDVTIGSDVCIHPFAAIHSGTVIGDRVTIHSGSVIGSDGFGYVLVDGKHRKIPQIGKVLIGDDVEIGANVAIDRARTGVTEIGSGTKIDNLSHIAHNVKIGRNSLVVALTGIAGSVSVGDYVVLAGQSGVKDHVRIGDRVVVAARAGVIGDLPEDARVSGFPARDHNEQMRMYAALQHLPEAIKTIAKLEERLAELEGRKERGMTLSGKMSASDRQCTFGRKAKLSGAGLHSGEIVEIVLRPADEDTGIVFLRDNVAIPALAGNVVDTRRGATVGANGVTVMTVEHVMAALRGCGVDNAVVEVSGPEMPALDGSSLPFVDAIGEAGVVEQSSHRRRRTLRETVVVESNGARVTASPSDSLSFCYELDYDHPMIGRQCVEFSLGEIDFATEIAPARTFVLYEEVAALLDQRLAQGGNADNTIVIWQDHMSCPLRFPDELARHKALDLIGDLALVGFPMNAEITAVRSGHALNVELAKKIIQVAVCD